MKKMLIYATSLVLLVGTLPALGQVRLPKLVSSGMVLQRNTDVRLWGWAGPGEEVTIRFLGKTYTTTTKPDGEWAVILSPMNAGGPYSMEIDAGNHIVLNDVLVGDVWLCSGQSNMVLPMERVKPKYRSVIAHSGNSEIRQFFVPNVYNFSGPQEHMQGGKWLPANSWTVLDFTAAGYFFARNLWEKYHVPIGLINASVGGTPIEAWMSEEALKEFPGALKTVDNFRRSSYVDSVKADNAAAYGTWYSYIYGNDEGLNGPRPWYAQSFDVSSWPTMEVPSYWNVTGLKDTHGVVWFRRDFNVPDSLAGKRAKLLMGRIVDADYDYINGVFVGSVSYQYPPRRYNVAAGLLKPGKNSITVRLINYAGRGGFIKDKPYEIRIGNHTIDLTGKWHYKLGVATGTIQPTTFIQYEPEGLFNGMIAPVLNYTIKGAIWYQGESNCDTPQRYAEKFSSMITDWRAKWGEGNFPFIFVQLPNYGPAAGQPPEHSGWAKIRAAQLKTLSLPNTGMAVAVDIGEWNDIHPLDKGNVGKRLALAAEHVAYGDNNIVYSGPIYKSSKIEGNKIIVSFSNVGSGLMSKGGPLKWFEIAGKDRKFVFAKAKISGNKVIVRSDRVQYPTVVRYAWADNPAGANLYNKEGLPASPFEAEVAHR